MLPRTVHVDALRVGARDFGVALASAGRAPILLGLVVLALGLALAAGDAHGPAPASGEGATSGAASFLSFAAIGAVAASAALTLWLVLRPSR